MWFSVIRVNACEGVFCFLHQDSCLDSTSKLIKWLAMAHDTWVGLARSMYIYIHIYTECIQNILQVHHKKYGHIRCMYTVLANPRHKLKIVCIRCWPTLGVSWKFCRYITQYTVIYGVCIRCWPTLGMSHGSNKINARRTCYKNTFILLWLNLCAAAARLHCRRKTKGKALGHNHWRTARTLMWFFSLTGSTQCVCVCVCALL
jgi:hypothetical protein